VECVAATTGETRAKVELPKNRHAYSASPVVVDGRVIVIREDGQASLLTWPRQVAEERLELVGPGGGNLEEMTVATPVCVDGRMFVRTHDSLWCIGEN
jgi:outer membrane protein assembly factor BamB